MLKTKNYEFNKPEPEDYVVVGDLNYNMDEIDKLLKAVNDALDILSTNGVSLLDLLKKKADLDDKGKVLVSQLPDLDVYKDVLMYEAKGNFPASGNDKKIYVDKSENKIYHWTGTVYDEISKQLKIGEVKDTAFDGARGKALEDEMGVRYTKKEVDTLLLKKVNAVNGKGLSTYDFTSEYKKKLDDAEVKKISGDSFVAYKYGQIVTVIIPKSLYSYSDNKLPVGFRPSTTVRVIIGHNRGGSPITMYVDTDGSIRYDYPGDDSNSHINSVTFTYITEE